MKTTLQVLAITVLMCAPELCAAGTLLTQGTYEEVVQKLQEKAKDATNGPMMVEIGDDAVKIAAKFPKHRQGAIDLASEWYGKAWPSLDDFWRMKLGERLVRLYVPLTSRKPRTLPEGWGGSLAPGNQIDIRSERVHSGCSAVSVVPGKSGLGSFLRSPEIPLPAGKEIEVSAWALSDDLNQGTTIVLHVSDKNGKPLASLPISFEPMPIFQCKTLKMALPDGSAKASFDCVSGATKTIIVDDLSVKLDGKELLPTGGFEK